MHRGSIGRVISAAGHRCRISDILAPGCCQGVYTWPQSRCTRSRYIFALRMQCQRRKAALKNRRRKRAVGRSHGRIPPTLAEWMVPRCQLDWLVASSISPTISSTASASQKPRPTRTINQPTSRTKSKPRGGESEPLAIAHTLP